MTDRLAYTFWHWPRPGEDPGAYLAGLQPLHDAIALPGSCSWTVSAAPFLPGAGTPLVLDWWPVEGWAALGELNERAVSGSRRGVHDQMAVLAAGGAGGVAAELVAGDPVGATRVAWLAKPAGAPYRGWTSALRSGLGPGAALWQRQMVLGPAPEFTVLSPGPLDPHPDVLARAALTLVAHRS